MEKNNKFVWIIESKLDGAWTPVDMAISRSSAREYQADCREFYQGPTRIVKYFSNNQAE